MKMSDLEKDEQLRSYTGKALIWGDEVRVSVFLDDDSLEMCDETAGKAAAVIVKAAELAEGARNAAEQTLIDNDYISLAGDWASSAEEAEDEEQECYVMEDGSKVFFPITEEDFRKSLHIDEVSVYVDAEFEYESITAYVVCRPDYFAYHAIDTEIYPDGTVEEHSLAG